MTNLHARSIRRLIPVISVLTTFSLLAAGAERTVEGVVYYHGREPVPGAAVQLEDISTMQIISHNSDGEGRFKFLGLSPDKDYKIRAMKNGHWSKERTISRFSSRTVENVVLFLREKD